ncbi:hypothetical protein Save01_08459 [Streptomyces avermitilis]|uniref:Uncharacterized protein n=3 Tax=Streptomyces avermitilis TaxID=33903 RepID=A0A143T0T3_STRAW|nr:hypothetical protein SAVERM_2p180 [Streptomyces avermitilis MA-4680 = NBRC 14893]GDY70292.1 hypothetical protein SAV14893_096850 [Streptomyces avermitilis]GDY80600.1 hypothetical protein SAV31267_100850 [Streptomyces avermitilis]
MRDRRHLPQKRREHATPEHLTRHGNSCYHAGMAKTQSGARIDQDVMELAKARARDRGQSIGDYIAHLVREDADGLRVRGLDAARRFLDEHQAVFDEVEDAEQSASGARAA